MRQRWEKEMKHKQILMGGITAGILIELIFLLLSSVFQSIFRYDVLQLAGMRSVEDPVAVLFFVYPFVLAFALAYGYSRFESVLDGKPLMKGWKFGLIMWVIVSVPSAFLVFSSMTYPLGFTVNAIISSLIYMILAGIVIAKTAEWAKTA